VSKLVLLGVILLLVACQEQQTAVRITSLPLPVTATTPATSTAVSTRLPGFTPSPPPSPAHTATPALIQVGLAGDVPVELANTLQAVAASNPALVWQTPADVELAINGEMPLANWVYAVAAPFSTFQDDISLAELQAAWRAGILVLDAETNQVLLSWWGVPDQASTVVCLFTSWSHA
jgi:hypothetical protein